MDMILKIWLNTPPSATLIFTRLSLIEVLISSISLPLMTAARAPGKMMHYEITLGFIQIIIFVVSWQTLVNGNPAYYVFVIAIIANLLMFIIRLLFVKKLIGLSIRSYFVKVVFPIFKVIVLSSICSVLFHSLLPDGIIAMFFSLIISFLISVISVYIFGIEEEFRKKLRLLLCAKLKSFSIIAWTS
jgi:hypothetical protein